MELSAKVDASQMKNELYDVIAEVMDEVVEDKKQEHDLPVLMNKKEMAKHIFNVSYQTLDTHIIHKSGFPQIPIGERIMYPRDEVLQWIRDNTEYVNNIAPNRLSAI